MEFRSYNLLRQPKYRYEFLPSEFISLANYRANQPRLKRVTRAVDRVISALVVIGAIYITYHVLCWVAKP